MSTDSGIPDYRGPTSIRATPDAVRRVRLARPRPQRRYWARSFLGWRRIGHARPNDGHRALVELERAGLSGVITQNVDGLHDAAGSSDVINLHGESPRWSAWTAETVRRARARPRSAGRLNPDLDQPSVLGHAELRPDGDAVVDQLAADFVLADCLVCGGRLKPDVVFFGESVPKPRVERAYRLVDRADVLVVLGSSLTVMSGLRFVRHNAKQRPPGGDHQPRPHPRRRPGHDQDRFRLLGDPCASWSIDSGGLAVEHVPEHVADAAADLPESLSDATDSVTDTFADATDRVPDPAEDVAHPAEQEAADQRSGQQVAAAPPAVVALRPRRVRLATLPVRHALGSHLHRADVGIGSGQHALGVGRAGRHGPRDAPRGRPLHVARRRSVSGIEETGRPLGRQRLTGDPRLDAGHAYRPSSRISVTWRISSGLRTASSDILALS